MQRKNALVTIVTNPQSAVPLTLKMVCDSPVRRGVAFGARLIATGGTGGYVYSITGGVPAALGATLNATTGIIIGTPTTIGHVTFTAQVQDSSSTVYTATFAIDVQSRLVATAGTPVTGEIGIAYSYTFAVSGATGAVTWAATGTLPAGLTLSSAGLLSGTPTGTAGTSYFTATATDAGSGDTLDIAASASIANAMDYLLAVQTANLPVGVPLRIDASIEGGNYSALNTGVGPYTYTASGGNDAWLSIDAHGIITGTPPLSAVSPTIGGAPQPSITFNFSATDSLGAVATNGILGSVIPNGNAPIQPQDAAGSNIGPAGPYNIKFIGFPSVTNDGTTVEITAPTGGTAGAYLQAPNNLSDVVSAATSRTNLGLGSAATQSSSAFDSAGAAAAAQAASQPVDADLTAIAAISTTGWLQRTGAGAWSTGTPTASVSWGGITGTLSAQTDLQSALNLKTDNASAAITGGTAVVSSFGLGAAPASGGKFDITDYGRFAAASSLSVPTSGKGVEIYYYTPTDTGNINSYDRGLATYKPLNLSGSAVTLQYQATPRVSATSTGVTLTGTLSLPGTSTQYVRGDGVLATLPAGTVTGGSGGTTGMTLSGSTTLTLSGTLAVANGGTGSTTATAALTALGAMPKAGGAFTGGITGTTASFSGNITQSSDARFKRDVRNLADGLAIVRSLRARRFHNILTEREDIGFIAQELRDALPEVVITDDNGDLAVDYARIVAPLAWAVQVLDANIAQLIDRVAALESRA